MTTFYIIDKRSQIINAVETTSLARAERVAGLMVDADHLRVTATPTAAQLSGYRYWNERP